MLVIILSFVILPMIRVGNNVAFDSSFPAGLCDKKSLISRVLCKYICDPGGDDILASKSEIISLFLELFTKNRYPIKN